MKKSTPLVLSALALLAVGACIWGGCRLLFAGDPGASGLDAEASSLNAANRDRVQPLRAEAQASTVAAARAEVAVMEPTPREDTGENEIQVLLYDAETGLRLEQGTILFTPEEDCEFLREPPDSFNRLIVRNGLIPDPIRLEPADAFLWATSSGYEWKSVLVRNEGRVITIPLRPVGRLKVVVARWSPSCVDATGDLAITVRHNGRLLTTSEYDDEMRTSGSETFLFGKVPVGNYSIAARRVGPFGSGPTVGAQDAVVVRGERTVVELELADGSAPGASLTVIASAVGGPALGPQGVFDKVSLYSMDQDGLAFVGSDHRVAWKERAEGNSWEHVYHCLDPGTYRVMIAPIGLTQEVTLHEGSKGVVVFEIMNWTSIAVEIEPCLLSDGMTHLEWGYVAQPRKVHQSISLPGKSAKVRLDCVTEPLWVQVLGRTVCSSPQIITPTLGEEQLLRVTCDLARTSVIDVAVIPSGPELLASKFWMSLDAVAHSHEGVLKYVSLTAKAEDARRTYSPGTIFGTLVFDTPGPYHLTYPTSSGQTRDVEIIAGETNVGLLEIVW